jgi:hypothetical protein
MTYGKVCTIQLCPVEGNLRGPDDHEIVGSSSMATPATTASQSSTFTSAATELSDPLLLPWTSASPEEAPFLPADYPTMPSLFIPPTTPTVGHQQHAEESNSWATSMFRNEWLVGSSSVEGHLVDWKGERMIMFVFGVRLTVLKL